MNIWLLSRVISKGVQCGCTRDKGRVDVIIITTPFQEGKRFFHSACTYRTLRVKEKTYRILVWLVTEMDFLNKLSSKDVWYRTWEDSLRGWGEKDALWGRYNKHEKNELIILAQTKTFTLTLAILYSQSRMFTGVPTLLSLERTSSSMHYMLVFPMCFVLQGTLTHTLPILTISVIIIVSAARTHSKVALRQHKLLGKFP